MVSGSISFSTLGSPLYVYSFAQNILTQPVNITAELNSGSVFVSDKNTNQIYYFKSTGLNFTLNPYPSLNLMPYKPLGMSSYKKSDGIPYLSIMRSQTGNNNYTLYNHRLSDGLSTIPYPSIIFSSPESIALKIDNENIEKIYATSSTNQIKVYDVQTENESYIPLNNGETATSLSLNGDYLYVAIRNTIAGLARITAINPNNLNSTFTLPNANMVLPSAIVTTSNNSLQHLWLVDESENEIQYYSSNINPPNYIFKGRSNGNGLDTPISLALNVNLGILYTLETGDGGRIRIFFAPEAWVQPGRSILQQLTLDRSLNINNGRRLRVSKKDDDGFNIVNNQPGYGKLTLNTASCILTLSSAIGYTLEADEFYITNLAQLVLEDGTFQTGLFQLNNGIIKINQSTSFEVADVPSMQLINNGNTLQITSGKSLTINSPLTGNGDLKVESASPQQGILRLFANNSGFNGPIEIDEAIVEIGANLHPLGMNQVTLLTNATLRWMNDATLDNDFVIGTVGNFDANGHAAMLTGNIGENGNSSLNVWGDLTTEGDIGLTGISIQSNSKLTPKGSFTTAPTISIASGSELDLSSQFQPQIIKDLNGSAVDSRVILGDKSLTLESDLPSSYYGTIEGDANSILIKKGAGNLSLYSNSHAGSTQIEEGGITAFTPTSFGNSEVSMYGNTSLIFGTNNLIIGNIIGFDGTNPGDVVIDTGGFISTLTGAITQLTNGVLKLIIKGGGGVLNLNNQASHNGGVEVAALTTLKAGVVDVLQGVNTPLSLLANAIFDMSLFDQRIGGLQGLQGSQILLGDRTLTLTDESNFDGTFIGVGGSVTAQHNLSLGGQHENTGTLTVDASNNPVTVTMKANSSLAAGSSLSLLSSGANIATFDMQASSQEIRNLNGNANSIIKLDGRTLTVNIHQPSIFAGNIEGLGGSFYKEGPSTLTLSGNNDFNGGLHLEEGSLLAQTPQSLGQGTVYLSDATTLGVGQSMTILNPISLEFGTATIQTDYATTIDGIITDNGYGGFVKTGSAPLTLTRANPSRARLREGTLVVEGSIGDVVVEAGGRLTGLWDAINNRGFVGHVFNEGIVAPSNPVGEFRIKGDYSSPSSGTIQIDVSPLAWSKLHVEGTAHLNGTYLAVNVVSGEPEDYKGKSFEVLSSDNLITTQFSDIQSSQIRYKWKANYAVPNSVHLVFDGRRSFEEIVRSVSDNPSYIEAAHYFDHLTPEPGSDLSNIISTLDAHSEAHGITDIFSEISPDELTFIEETASIVNEINGFRMHYLRDMSVSPLSGTAFTTVKNQRSTSLLTHLKRAFGQVRADDSQARGPSMSLNMEKQMKDSALMMGPKGGIWLQGFGNYSKQKSTARDLGYQNKMGGSLIGVDYKLRPDLFVGFAMGYDQSRIKWSESISEGKVKDYLASLYSTWFWDKFYLNASLTGSYNRYNIRRRMKFVTFDRTARGRHDGYVLAPSLEIGHGFTLMNGFEVVPFIRGDYIRIHERGYQEKEAGALNLHIRKRTNTSLRTEPGLNFYHHIKREEGIYTTKVKLSYVNKHPLKHGKITANLVGQPGSFLASGSNKTQHQVSPGLALDYKATSGFFISAAYDTQLGAKYKAHEISLKVGTKF